MVEEIIHLPDLTLTVSLHLLMDMLKQDWHYLQTRESGRHSGCLEQTLEAQVGHHVEKSTLWRLLMPKIKHMEHVIGMPMDMQNMENQHQILILRNITHMVCNGIISILDFLQMEINSTKCTQQIIQVIQMSSIDHSIFC